MIQRIPRLSANRGRQSWATSTIGVTAGAAVTDALIAMAYSNVNPLLLLVALAVTDPAVVCGADATLFVVFVVPL